MPKGNLFESLESRYYLFVVSGSIVSTPTGSPPTAPLQGWTVQIFQNSENNPTTDRLVGTAVTGADGTFRSGNLADAVYTTVKPVLQTGYALIGTTSYSFQDHSLVGGDRTGANFVVSTNSAISGYVINDTNNDGVIDYSSGRVSGAKVYLDNNDNGVLDTGEPNATSDWAGAYTIGGITPGANVVLRVMPPAGWVVTHPTGDGAHRFKLDSAPEMRRTVNFGAFNTRQGSIGGTAFYDFNRNGVRDFGENGLHYRYIYLDLNDDGIIQSGEPNHPITDGWYSFSNLAAGTYTLIPSVGNGWEQTTPDPTQKLRVTVPLNQNVTAPPIGQRLAVGTTGNISGIAFDDTDGDGVRDAGEPVAANRQIFIDSSDDGEHGWYGTSTIENYTITDSQGRFFFGSLTPGTYRLRQTLPASSVQTTPAPGTALSVTVVVDQQNEVVLGAKPSAGGASLTATLFRDLDRDGVKDAGETAAAYERVYLDADGDNTLDPGEASLTSNASGVVTFRNLPAGTYRVRVDADAQQLITGISNGTAVVNVAANSATVVQPLIGVQDLTQFATITGKVWDDVDGNGVQTVFDRGADYATVYVDLNNNAQLDAGEPSTHPNWANGGPFSIKVYNPGSIQNYTVRLLKAPNYRQFLPANDAALSISLGLNQSGDVGTFATRRLDPSARAPANLTVAEGKTLALSGALSAAVESTIVKYEWDFDWPIGGAFTVDATGESATFDASGIDGQAYRSVCLRVTDARGLTDIDWSTVTITNAAPTATLLGSTVNVGSPSTVSFSQVTDVPADLPGLRYSYDFNNDGDFTDAGDVSNATSATASFTFPAGTHTVRARIADKDGGYTDYTTNVNVAAVVAPVTLQSESAAMSGGTVKASNNAGFTGTGFADYGGQGSAVTYSLTRTSAGTATLEFRYANGSTANRPLQVLVNNVVVGTVACAPTGGWTSWRTVSLTNVALPSGSVSIKAIASTSTGGANVDSLTVTSAGTVTPPPVDPPPVDPPPVDPPAGEVVIQSESATMSGGTAKASNNAGFTGTGFADYAGQGSAVTYSLTRSSAGAATLTFRYANGSTANRPLQILVNNVVVGTVACAPTGSWTTWKTVSLTNINLPSGAVAIKAIASTSVGGANVDSLTVTGGGTVVPPPPPPPPPSGTTGSISGVVWTETDADGKREAGETLLANKQVFIDLDRDGVIDANEKVATTNAQGVYTFSGLTAGTYRVGRVKQSGYWFSSPKTGYWEITLGEGENRTGVDIGTANKPPV